MGHFDGQIAIVTGGGGGLGREYALLLAAEGAKVVVNDYGGDSRGTPGTSAMADEVVAEIQNAGGQAVADGRDVALAAADIVRTALEAFGGLHIVVNNAGIAGGGTLETIPAEDFDRMVAIHLGGTLGVSRAAWPILRAQGYGRIVNTSSASVFGLPGTSHYITAKAAIFGLTRALAHDGRSYRREGQRGDAIGVLPSHGAESRVRSPDGSRIPRAPCRPVRRRARFEPCPLYR